MLTSCLGTRFLKRACREVLSAIPALPNITHVDLSGCLLSEASAGVSDAADLRGLLTSTDAETVQGGDEATPPSPPEQQAGSTPARGM